MSATPSERSLRSEMLHWRSRAKRAERLLDAVVRFQSDIASLRAMVANTHKPLSLSELAKAIDVSSVAMSRFDNGSVGRPTERAKVRERLNSWALVALAIDVSGLDDAELIGTLREGGFLKPNSRRLHGSKQKTDQLQARE